MLKKKFVAVGNSWSIIVPKNILDALGINPVLDNMSLELENNRIVLKKLPREQ